MTTLIKLFSFSLMQNISSRMNNISTVSEFIIFCFPGPWIFQFLQAGFFIAIYLTALMGNGLIFIVTSFSSVQSLGRIQFFETPWTAAHQASLSITNSQSILKLMSIELVIASNHLILCHPFLLLLSIFPRIRVFSNESVLCLRWPKYWSFSINPFNEYSGLISFRMD